MILSGSNRAKQFYSKSKSDNGSGRSKNKLLILHFMISAKVMDESVFIPAEEPSLTFSGTHPPEVDPVTQDADFPQAETVHPHLSERMGFPAWKRDNACKVLSRVFPASPISCGMESAVQATVQFGIPPSGVILEDKHCG